MQMSFHRQMKIRPIGTHTSLWRPPSGETHQTQITPHRWPAFLLLYTPVPSHHKVCSLPLNVQIMTDNVSKIPNKIHQNQANFFKKSKFFQGPPNTPEFYSTAPAREIKITVFRMLLTILVFSHYTIQICISLSVGHCR